jgi:hypothetical protein
MSITEGDIIVRTQGRPSSIGRRGVVMTVHPDVIGTGGDILLTVIDEESGTTWQAYDRQVKRVGSAAK